MLTGGQKKQRVKIRKQLLIIFLMKRNVVTGDETWVNSFKSVRKLSSKIWATKNSKRPVIAKRTLGAKKILYAIFFSGEGIQVPVKKGKSVTRNCDKDVVLKKLKKKSAASTAPCPPLHLHEASAITLSKMKSREGALIFP